MLRNKQVNIQTCIQLRSALQLDRLNVLARRAVEDVNFWQIVEVEVRNRAHVLHRDTALRTGRGVRFRVRHGQATDQGDRRLNQSKVGAWGRPG